MGVKMYWLLLVSLSFFAIVHGIVIPDQEQFILLENTDRLDALVANKKNYSRIAIIGSGITGATAAFRLAERYRRGGAREDQQPTITVFERNEVVGGRITLAYAYNDTRYPVDTCAVTFGTQDTCTSQAAGAVGLAVIPDTPIPRGSGVGVWDGKKFVGFVEEDQFRQPNFWSFFRQMKNFKRYGNAPWTASQDATNVRLNFNQLLAANLNSQLRQFGQSNLSKSIENAGLQGYVQNFICAGENAGISFPTGRKGGRFVDEVLTAAQRERFFGSIFDLNVLEFLFGYENVVESGIDGGNLRLIERLLRIATDDIRLGTEVRRVMPQLTGEVKLLHGPTGVNATTEESFDAVIIATALERSTLFFDPPLQDVIGLGQKYRDSFVTHFTTSTLLNGSYFNREGTMPQKVYTTETIEDFFDGKDEPLFFSLQLVKQLQNPDNGLMRDYLFKLVSRYEISNTEIEKMLLGPRQPGGPKITWIDRRPLPQSIPITEAVLDECKILLEKTEIAPNVYYAGAGEQVIGSAEIGCRMGLNVANLILEGEQPLR